MANTIIELVWDCPYCHTKYIQGHEYICPNCGRRRGEETKFYRPDVDVIVKGPIDKRPDWYCDSCGSYNKAADLNCHSCGAPRSTETYFDVQKRLKEKTAVHQISSDIIVNDDCEEDGYTPFSEPTHDTPVYDATPVTDYSQPKPVARTQKRTSFHSFNMKWLAIIAILLLGIILLWPKCKTITVNRTDWSRSIQIEQNTLVEENDWNLPSDAEELLYTRQEIHHYDHVLDHYETVTEYKTREVFDGYDTYYTYNDLGNGYAERVEHQTPKYRTESYTEMHEEPVYRDEPVYRTKYYYTIWRYKYHHSVTVSDYSDITHTVEPYWPEYQLSNKQRIGAHIEKYAITCTECKKQKNYTCDYELWVQFIPGDTYKVKTAFGRITKIIE